MEKRYRVTLTEQERRDLMKLVSTGKGAAKKLRRARLLLLADEGEGGSAKSDAEIVDALGCGRATVERAGARLATTASPARLRTTIGRQGRSPVGGVGVQCPAGRPIALDVAAAVGSPRRAGICRGHLP